MVRFEDDPKHEDIDDDDFGLHYPMAYVIKTWMAYRNWGILPSAGGYDDQDEMLMQDWQTLTIRYHLAKQRYAFDKGMPKGKAMNFGDM